MHLFCPKAPTNTHYTLVFKLQAASDDEEKEENISKVQQVCKRIRSYVRNRWVTARPSKAKVHDRSIRKHQKRLSSGAATRIQYPGLSDALMGATETLIASGCAGDSGVTGLACSHFWSQYYFSKNVNKRFMNDFLKWHYKKVDS